MSMNLKEYLQINIYTMDGSTESPKPHAVLVPYPAQGHVTPMMRLANLLHSKGFHITFVNTEFNHRRLIRNRGPDAVKGLPDFIFQTIPDGLPPSDKDATQDVPALCDSTRKNCLLPFLDLLKKLGDSPGVPPVTCVVADGVMGFGSKAARMLGIPEVQFWTASACGLLGYLQYSELLKTGIVPFKDESFLSDGTLDEKIDWVPGMSNIRMRDLPSFMRTTDPNEIMFDFLGTEAQHCLKSSAIVMNTFDELEQEVLDALAAMTTSPIYTIGPLPLLERHLPEEASKSFRSSLWKEDFTCIDWLDTQKPDSVIYVNYGSITVMSDDHLKEFAAGLADSKRPFLWIMRPDVVMGESAVLPPEFMDEVKERGFLAAWCAQEEVLQHGAVAVFLTHCGWNSTVESISGGKPMLCWPFFAEQQTNCRYACVKWKNGLEVDPDVKREEIKAVVEEMMEKESGKKVMENALEWKKKAEAAAGVGGSSYLNFHSFVAEALLPHPHNL